MKALLLASILLTGSPVFAEGQTANTQELVSPKTTFMRSSELIQTLRADLLSGRYADFLADMDKAYHDAKEGNQLEGLIEIRKEAVLSATDQFAQGYETIQAEKNSALLKAVKEQNGVFADKVRSAATNNLNDQELDALQSLAFVRSNAPGTGKNIDENRLLEIDLEYAYKSIHLDSKVAAGQNIPDRKEKQLILEMSRMDQMLQASQGFEDKTLKAEVELVSSTLDARLTRASDVADLNLLVKGKMKPSSDVETQVAQILSQANEQLTALHLDVMNAQL